MLTTLALSLLLMAGQDDWKTVYEKSGYTETGRYQEAVNYCRRLEKASRYARVLTFGVSPEGRPMIALLLSKERTFTPEALRKSQKPLVFLNNGIHSGEIEGKDAGFILAREILITKREEALLEGANLLIVPIFSVDAHERFSAFNRINQNGPKEMGWRTTGVNLNLNRDYMKADGEEMRAMLTLLHTWKPDFFFDNHTTDGGDWQYTIQYGVPLSPTVPAPVLSWSEQMLKEVQPVVEREGYLMAPYFSMRDSTDPTKGFTVDDFGPRYSTGYLSALNRPCMLVETHVLKPYKQRVEATYSINKRVIEYCIRTATALKAANRAADRAEEGAQEGEKFVLSGRLSTERKPFTFKGYPYRPYRSEISGSLIPHWEQIPTDYPSTIQETYLPLLTLAAPAAYAIPTQWKEIISRLSLHNLKFTRLKEPVTAEFSTYRFEKVTFPREPFEGRHQPNFQTLPVTEARTLPAGTVIVRTNQVGTRLLMHLLEPEAPDSLLRWGLFNAIFEQKEYGEAYATEPYAQKMLANDPKLRAEFEERLKDPVFAGNSSARLDFFYSRSPYRDVRLNAYPIVRLTARQLQSLR